MLSAALETRAFPAAVVEVGTNHEILWREPFGALTYETDAPAAANDTVFDLASLTKVIATTTIAMRLIDAGRMNLDDTVARWLPDWRGEDRSHAAVRDLLAHATGLTAYMPLFRDHFSRREFERSICTLPLEHPPGTRSTYSDLGFILLGFVLEHAGGASLSQQFEPIRMHIGTEPVLFNPPRAWRDRIAPTELDTWRGRLLVGEVHDENAAVLGGAAGHAGLFGTAGAVGAFARFILETVDGSAVLVKPETAAVFLRRVDVPNSSRALGWDTMLPTSSCGTRLSPTAVGHTGFTGTSLWIDLERKLYVVFLTNRVCPARSNEAILKVRPAFHDAVMLDLGF